MTQNGNLKRRVRARAAKTGESYTAALSNIRKPSPEDDQEDIRSVRLAVAQTTFYNDPRNIPELRASGQEIRSLMHEAHKAGARVIHLPEGATCSPNKRVMSASGPREIGPADWNRFEWTILSEELDAIRQLAKELRLWTIVGSVHRLSSPHRPHNSLYVISDDGELINRYDERMLSNTKISFLYSPGNGPAIFEVDGICFGCSLGMEAHYPEIFIEYERLGVDCVLFSTTGEISPNAPASAFSAEVAGHAASNSYWVSYSAHSPQSITNPSGIARPDGRWAAQCEGNGRASIALADVSSDPKNLAWPWRRKARGDLYTSHRINSDPRSEDRHTF